MIFDLFRLGSLDDQARMQLVMSLAVRVFVVFCVLPIHEFAHAFVADKLGDHTAKLKGRLTIAPMAHIDWIGALMLFLVGFGYAKPVPVNIRNFRKKTTEQNDNVYYMGSQTRFDPRYAKLCMALVGLAGPLSNLIMALLSLIVANAIAAFASVTTLTVIIYYFFSFCAMINVNLAVFNLLPIPPLDGSRLLSAVLPDKIYFKIMQYERYIMLGLMLLLFTNVLSTPLSFVSDAVFGLMNNAITALFSLF